MPQTILIVDDSATMRSVLRLYLRNEPYEFAEAETAERALHLTRLLKPALVIVDLNLPGMDGIQLTTELRARQTGDAAAIPVMVLTGEEAEAWREKAETAGANMLMKKPVSPAQLKSAVETLLSGRTP